MHQDEERYEEARMLVVGLKRQNDMHYKSEEADKLIRRADAQIERRAPLNQIGLTISKIWYILYGE